eukprot:s634_g5.t1
MFAVNARRAIAVASAATVKLHWDRREGNREGWERSRPLRCEELTLQAAAQRLLPHTVQFAELHGLLYGAKDTAHRENCSALVASRQDRSSDASAATQCPVAMLPFKIPRRAFDVCVALSPLWNQLVDAAARDLQWLYTTLEPAAKADDFTARLLQMSKELHKEGLRQPMMLGIHRSEAGLEGTQLAAEDYMLHESGTPRFLQVELNTIASSMASHSANVRKLHNYVLGRYGSQSDDVGRSLQAHFGVPSTQIVDRLPENEIPRAFAKAHAAHGVKDAFVLFVVQDDERNFADQRFLEYALWEDSRQISMLVSKLHSNLRGRTMESKCFGREYDLKGKVVAVFGCGAKMVGYVDESGYSYGESKSVKDGKFLGLPLDEDNEDDQTDDRIAAWVEQLKGEGMPL